MKVKKTHIRLVGYTGLSAFSYALIVLIMSSVFGVRRYDLQIDDRIIPELNTKLAAHVKTLPLGIWVAPHLSAQVIQEQFPWIKSLSFYRMPTQTMRITVALEEPKIKVNDAIITEQSRVFPASTFNAASITNLPKLTIQFPTLTDSVEVPDAFISHAQTFTTERFAPYTITWIDEYTARLTDKEQPNFVIQFNANTIPDAAMFAHCGTIKQRLQERGSFEGRQKGTRWVADIRFERQVILFSEDKGVTRG